MSNLVIPLVGKNNMVTNVNFIEDVIGQVEARRKLAFFVASHSEQTAFPTTIFTGSQGLGKSFMAKKVSESLGRELVEINCGTIPSSKEFIEEVLIGKLMSDTPKTLLLDEAQNLLPDVVTTLLSILNPTDKNKNYIEYKLGSIEYDFTSINTILATTDAHKVFRPLVNRCVEIYFSLYSNDELFEILCHYLKDIRLVCDKEDIACACRGRARDAYILSQNIKRYCIMNKINVFGNSNWKDLKNIFGIHIMGLTTQEIEYLKVINRPSPISSANIAIKLGINVQNVESEIEIRPRELGFVENGSRGRQITEVGKEYLKKNVRD